MALLTEQYVYLTPGPHRRQPRSAGGGTTEIPGYPIGNGKLSPGPYMPPGVPPTISSGDQTFTFGFSSISGGLEGPLISFNPAQLPQVTVTANPITILNVYVLTGGKSVVGPLAPGATMDAWDESTEALIDDDFVSV